MFQKLANGRSGASVPARQMTGHLGMAIRRAGTSTFYSGWAPKSWARVRWDARVSKVQVRRDKFAAGVTAIDCEGEAEVGVVR